MSRHFASDNYAGACPEVIDALTEANSGHEVAYGEDSHTARFSELVRLHFGEQAEAFPVFNGTGANVTALQACTPRWGSVICAASAHVNVDEGGAPEKTGGLKLWTVPTSDGKLTPELIDTHAWGFGDVHRAQPTVVTITQVTELGTLYTADEIRAICDHAHAKGLYVHLDGARLANAAAALGTTLRALTTDCGVDIVSFGGTKNGAIGAEAVIVLNPRLRDALPYLRKSMMQLASKMRFISAQLNALLTDDLWRRNAEQANRAALRLEGAASEIAGVVIARKTQANSVFALIPPDVAAALRDKYRFYTWDEQRGEVRWMCSWDTTDSDVDDFVSALANAFKAQSK